ncbi:MATE family efflux transporter [Robertmurraya sp. GLU-23]
MKGDFTEGSIYRKLLIFSLPIVLTNLLQASMQLINSLWVGNLLNSTAFGAVTIGMSVMTIVLAFALGSNNATLTIFSQLRGKGDPDEIRLYMSNSIVLLVLMSLAVGVLGYIFVEPLLALLNTPESLIPIAREYLKINFIGILFLVGYNFVSTVLRAFGDSRTPLYFILAGTIVNSIATPVFIVGFGMGVSGAAYATVLGYLVAFFYSLFYVARKYVKYAFKLQLPNWIKVKTILELGIPSIIQMIVIYAGMNVILSAVNAFGPEAVAGFGAAQRLDNLILLPAMALGTAVNAMAAQNIGANKWDRVSLTSRVGVIYNMGIMLAIAVVLFVCAEPLIKLFIKDPESVAFGKLYLETIAFFYPFLGLNFILNGIVRGSGAMFQVLVLNIISLWVFRVPLTYMASSLFGEIGIALGMGISFLISCLFSIAYYQWGGWRKKELFANERSLAV